MKTSTKSNEKEKVVDVGHGLKRPIAISGNGDTIYCEDIEVSNGVASVFNKVFPNDTAWRRDSSKRYTETTMSTVNKNPQAGDIKVIKNKVYFYNPIFGWGDGHSNVDYAVINFMQYVELEEDPTTAGIID